MAKRANQYNLVLTQISLANGEPGNQLPLDITFENHDEIFGIIEKSSKKILLTTQIRPQNLRLA